MNESLDLTVTSEMHQAPLDQAKNQLVPSGANGPADGMQELTNLLAGADTSLGTAPKLTSSLAKGTKTLLDVMQHNGMKGPPGAIVQAPVGQLAALMNGQGTPLQNKFRMLTTNDSQPGKPTQGQTTIGRFTGLTNAAPPKLTFNYDPKGSTQQPL